MKPSLHLSMSQQLTLTPQLQQAIRLLQLSTIDLQQEIEQVVEANPMLEMTRTEESPEPPEEYQWSQTPKKSHHEDSDWNFEQLIGASNTLHDYLRWQLDLTPMSVQDSRIGHVIIDAINDDGFLTIAPAELIFWLHQQDVTVDVEDVEAVRHKVMQFDPVGCGACDLQETLLVQMMIATESAQIKKYACAIIKNDLQLLAQHNYRQLMKNHHISERELANVQSAIQKLHPKPGTIMQDTHTEYVIPDVIVRKTAGTWIAALNQQALPRLHINQQYASYVQRADSSSDGQFLKHHLQEARWFIKSIQSRQETLLRVAQAIVAYQQDFFEFGPEAMKPLILNDVASRLNMHESTISRVTTQKFMHSPRGVFELKYFFSSHVSTKNGGECSSTAIRAVIRKLIAAEDRHKPLSDSKIAALIGAQGIQVARRTVAKYREALGILPSNERKEIAR